MLEEVLNYLNNYFVKEIFTGDFTIEDGKLQVTFLLKGQYFRIVGSTLNDGVYQYADDLELKDESFSGAIWSLAVPNMVISIADDIKAWTEKYGESASGPYSSESFGGYSYTKASDSSGESAWISAFKDKLAPYKKIRDMSYVQQGTAHQDPSYRRPFNPDYPWRDI